ncbi:putative WD repeat-containing protein RUP2-like [Iris pallida]|uniref:WD repeat-containing protein RUP2-like n=1 Tax=Iris pallida TaxID=29817 RepID=A0AAX6GYY9_IRIPA|nr:putative WD repeat-containing protein RUP2-like [Iris pallida]KAJ6833525.1 putative WD repeat-containing protein RUP2-like [Iris pallida]
MNYTSPEEKQQEQLEEDSSQARCEWDFSISAAVPRNPTTNASDVLGAVEVDPSGRLLATGGLARKIRIYTLDPLRYEFYICTPAKLSSLRWRPNPPGCHVASGDYDGVVTEYDVERRTPVSERDEHGGRRVWSVDYSAAGLGASGSDDGTAQMWDPRCGPVLSAVRVGASVCCVEFDKTDGPYIALGCADRRAYVYDVRNMSSGPVSVFAGHEKTVTYVRFDGRGRLVTSGTDGRHRLWELASGKEVRAYRGHANARSFVGMSVWRSGGLIGCGSESNEVFVYDLRWGEPIWVQSFAGRTEEEEEAKAFVSAVCWREVSEDECALLAGGSDGMVQVYAGRRKV